MHVWNKAGFSWKRGINGENKQFLDVPLASCIKNVFSIGNLSTFQDIAFNMKIEGICAITVRDLCWISDDFSICWKVSARCSTRSQSKKIALKNRYFK